MHFPTVEIDHSAIDRSSAPASSSHYRFGSVLILIRIATVVTLTLSPKQMGRSRSKTQQYPVVRVATANSLYLALQYAS